MLKLISCGFNMDTASVELRYQDGSIVSLNCPAIEDLVAENRVQRAELDWLIYNEPMTYARLVLSGKVIEYLNRPPSQRDGGLMLVDQNNGQPFG